VKAASPIESVWRRCPQRRALSGAAFVALLAGLLIGVDTFGRDGAIDSRIVHLTYRPEMVVPVETARGFVTQIVLQQSERIMEAAIGDSEGWLVVAKKGSHQIFVKPRESADHSNLAVITDRRIYTFDLRVFAAHAQVKRREPFYRIEFQYPGERTDRDPDLPDHTDGPDLETGRINKNYSMEMFAHSDAIAPDGAYDNGTFTYLRFAANKEIPAVFEVTADQSESLINLHFDGDQMVLHGVFKRLVLRLGDAAVGVWNEGWSVAGASFGGNATVSGKQRILREP
jgi:type IV secretion system protein VirB9